MAHDAPPEPIDAADRRIGFLGPEGTFTEEALLSEPAYRGAAITPFASLVEVLEAVRNGSMDLGFIPLENAIEGTVRDIIDSLVFDFDLRIQREVVLDIHLHLMAALGAYAEPLAPKLEIAAAEIQQAEDALLSDWRLAPKGVAPGKPPILLGLNPGAEYGPAKRWPAESFAAVAREVSRKFGDCRWLAFGGAGDWQLCSDIARLAGGGVLNLAGKTSLRQLMALLRLCRVVLTNDTGPMHVAAALGTTVIAPFGSTSPELTGPGFPGDPRHRLLRSAAPCSPCFRRVCPIDFRCLTSISPERVVEAVSQAISPR